jgi:hypothetical protein
MTLSSATYAILTPLRRLKPRTRPGKHRATPAPLDTTHLAKMAHELHKDQVRIAVVIVLMALWIMGFMAYAYVELADYGASAIGR